MLMNIISSGLSASDAQHAICTGQPYGRKEWSSSERREACQRYEKLTGKKVDVNISEGANPADFTVVIVAVAVLLVGSIYAFYRFKTNSNRLKKLKTDKRRKK
jgi:hypothetical protein